MLDQDAWREDSSTTFNSSNLEDEMTRAQFFAVGIVNAAICGLGAPAIACSDHDEHRASARSEPSRSVSADKAGTRAEAALIESMIPHHEMAVEMASVALEQGSLAEVLEMSKGITEKQPRESAALRKVYRKLFKNEVPENPMAHEEFGLSMVEAGMDIGPDQLAKAEPFDMAFLDTMIHHHRGAINMAEAALPGLKDAELIRMTKKAISDQNAEIKEMNDARIKHFGSPSPALAEDEDSTKHESH
jgi:uncharacterized protein (DUF305 family)